MRKIFNLGLSRTGTTSITKALQILGFRVRHDLQGGGEYKYLDDLWRGSFDWDCLKNFDAFADIPISIYYKELDRQFLNSKFILTVRNKEDWLASCQHHFSTIHKDISLVKRPLGKSWNMAHLDMPSLIRLMTYGRVYFDEPYFSDFYDQHKHDVQQYFKNRDEQLLILDICGGEGWEKLCPFFGLPIPDESFPNENKRK